MGISNRCSFLQRAAAAWLTSVIGSTETLAQPPAMPSLHGPRLGMVAKVGAAGSADATVKHVHDLGLPTCQIFFEHLSLQQVNPLQEALRKYGVEVSAVSEHNPGRRVFDF